MCNEELGGALAACYMPLLQSFRTHMYIGIQMTFNAEWIAYWVASGRSETPNNGDSDNDNVISSQRNGINSTLPIARVLFLCIPRQCIFAVTFDFYLLFTAQWQVRILPAAMLPKYGVATLMDHGSELNWVSLNIGALHSAVVNMRIECQSSLWALQRTSGIAADRSLHKQWG